MSSQKVEVFSVSLTGNPTGLWENGTFPAKGNTESHIWDRDSRGVKEEVAEEGDCWRGKEPENKISGMAHVNF